MSLKTTFLSLVILLLSGQILAQTTVIEQMEFFDNSTAVRDIIVDKANVKYLATNTGIYKLTNFETAPQLLKEGDFKTLAFAKGGLLFGGTVDGKVYSVKEGNEYKPSTYEGEINNILAYKGQLMVATDNGLYIYNLKSGKILNHYTEENSKLESNKVNFLHWDSYDVVWIGTDSGIHRMEDKELKKAYETDKSFTAITENNEGKWAVSDKEMYLIFDGNRWQELGLRKDLFEGTINDITIDTEGKLYLASDILVRINPYEDQIDRYTEDLGLISKQCLTIQTDKNNYVWIGTGDSGLYRIRFSDNESSILTATAIIESQPRCHDSNDGKVTISASGGKAPYKYRWSNNGIRAKKSNKLAAGEYTITVTDAEKNEYITSVELVAPSQLTAEINKLERISGSRKKDGKAMVSANGGTEPYFVSWSNGEKGVQAMKLPLGKNFVTVTDAEGCTEVLNVETLKQKSLPDLDIAKLEVGQVLRINDLYFQADSSLITDESYSVLNEIYEFMSDNPKVKIEIGGHTNGIPPHEYCDRLSSSRAVNVGAYLKDKGIQEDRIVAKGYGKREPIASNNSLAGRKKNQRVEIKILSISG